MRKLSAFNPECQAESVSSKALVALERVSQAFRVMLWNEGKLYGLSPIQIQLLTFLLHFPEEKRTVTFLAGFFNMTKATISDAVKALESKSYLTRKVVATDSRSSSLHLTREGKAIARKVEKFADPLHNIIDQLPGKEQGLLLEQLQQVIQQLSSEQILSVQSMCLNCVHYFKKKGHYCNAFKTSLTNAELRFECELFESGF
ncbi:DNA-binding transcriptional regulator, MarR family [Chitinophaga costaii]|uniref:DNA-binding transcriptional regulator, MarR family n=1 Tax=Chitinophaga costaii TaxID=1335309 RepID=A0A1C4B1P6_9BACT|nr:MarR family winged helix-turn-helix transcriptional regulator [Chitinophaga costaii]PUZ26833.1 MarR family transcriptional regulator [Chitinophaga costaii]SCC00632.1 DNA-binding transcriptional regulator, MarR family [Chitinophaga costaii]